MKSVDKIIISLLFVFMAGMAQAGTLTPGALFADNMVVQRDRPFRIFGTANAGQTVAISFAGRQVACCADTNGVWQTELSPFKASLDPLEMEITDGADKIILKNILVGDVWLCSGQSNMQRPVKAFSALKIDPEEKHPVVRVVATEQRTSAQPLDTVPIASAFAGSWQECSGEALQNTSATAFYFGTRLQRELNVPIGLVVNAWGGTRIEPWCSRETLESIGVVGDAGNSQKVNQDTPSALYNAMIYPLRNFGFKGVIWYQGESNARNGDPVKYRDVFSSMITDWRDLFGQPRMPFLFVQLAPFGGRGPAESWAVLRESQAKALSLPNTGMAVITDAGEFADIHPQQKRVVGERLALQALKLDGRSVAADSPVFSKIETGGSRCRLWFDHAESGLETRRVAMNRQRDLPPGTDPQAFVAEADCLYGFEICGADRKWGEARARILPGEPGAVEVWSDQVSSPVAVRYGWANFPLCNLYNGNGLPASPFRTDGFLNN
jgi:sialate O-acetylesterase